MGLVSAQGSMVAQCVEPTAEVLATGTDFAFAGTVTGIADDVNNRSNHPAARC
jgi:hypothetical protein